MAARGSGRPLSSLLLGPRLQRIAAKAAAWYGRVIRIKGFALASRWEDVEDILRRDLDFRIAPINGARIDEVNGPFVLGLDRGVQMAAERPQLYVAVSAIDLVGVRDLVAREAERLLDDAAAAHGRLDIVNGYARLVAARAARQIFGLAGPTETDLMRVIRAVFHHTFLNLGGDEQVRERALAAAEELRRWFLEEIAGRHRQAIKRDDVIGRLLALRGKYPDALDDDGVRRNVAGLLVGSIDTTATAVGKIVRMACADDVVLARIERDLDDPQRMVGWCNELLRMWTHNPILLRRAAADVELGGTTIAGGSTVVAFTQAAMFDPNHFSDPGRLDPTRSATLYRHFGGGLHPCAGRAVNDVQIPELVRRVLKRGISQVERPRYDGPFIDELVVSFRGSRN
jgi:cytochrome P450